MIENLRKYSGLMMVALVAVFAGLVFLVAPSLSRGGGGRGQPYMKIGDITYSYDEYLQLGPRSLEIAPLIGGGIDMYKMIQSLDARDPKKFFTNRMLLRQARDKFGVHPSDEEITEYIQKRSAFARKGEFDQNLYNEFINKRIGRYGLNEQDIRDIVSDYLAYEKLFEIIGSGLLADFDYARQVYADENQKLDLSIVEFPLSKYQGTINPAEEEIKTFWEENQDAYTTEDRRKFSYILLMSETAEEKPAADAKSPAPAAPKPAAPKAQPKPASAPAKPQTTPKPAAKPATQPAPASPAKPEGPPNTENHPPGDRTAPEKPAPAPSTESTAPGDTTTNGAPTPPAAPAGMPGLQFTPIPTDGKPAPTDPATAAKLAAEEEARKEAELKLAGEVDTFLGELQASQGANFETLVKEYGWQIKKSEWMTRKTLAPDLNRPLRDVQPGQTMAFYLFDNLTKTTDPLSVFTDPIPIEGGGWVIARLDEEDPVHPKTYEQARAEARADLIRQRATEAMKKEAEETLDKLKKAVEQDKKPFAEAVKELKLAAKEFKGFGRGARPAGMLDPRQVFEAAARVDPGHFAEVVELSDRSLIVFVAKRTLVKEENLQTRIENYANGITNRNKYIAFDAWLAQGRESAKMLVGDN